MFGCIPLPLMRSPHVFDPSEWGAVQLNTIGWTESGVSGTTSDGSYLITVDTASKRGKSIVVSQGGSGEWRACHWDLPGTGNTYEIYAVIKLDALPDATGGGGVTWTNTSGDGYDACFDSDGSPDSLRVGEVSGGTLAGVVASQDITADTSSRFHVLFYRENNGNTGHKCWKDGDAEPSYTTSFDNTMTGSRSFGIQTVQQKAFRVDFFAVCKGSGKAPRLAG